MYLFDKVFLTFIGLLNKHKVKFMLVGGHAVNLHGYSRATADMDIWVEPTNENAVKLAAAIEEFGYDGTELAELNFGQPHVFDLGELPERIEIMNFISGVAFNEAYPHCHIIKVEETDIPCIGLHYLKQNKKAAGRYRDLDDLEHL